MTNSDTALMDACVLAEEMLYKEMLAEFEVQPSIRIPDGQRERILNLIYGEETAQKDNIQIKEKKISSRRIKTAFLIAAILIILFTVTSTAFSPLKDFILRIYRECTEIVFDITNKDDYLFAEYTYIPKGYKKVKDNRVKPANFQSILYMNGQSRISISTLRNKHSSAFIDTEDAETGEILINGVTGYYSITETSLMLVWSTGKYNHCLTVELNGANINLEEIVKIAQSRNPVK